MPFFIDCRITGLKNQSCFPRAVCQSLNPSMIEKPAAVKDHILNTDLLESFRQHHTHRFGRLDLFQTSKGTRQFLAERRCLGQGPPRVIGNGLDIDMRAPT